jgi:hypothetical protein
MAGDVGPGTVLICIRGGWHGESWHKGKYKIAKVTEGAIYICDGINNNPDIPGFPSYRSGTSIYLKGKHEVVPFGPYKGRRCSWKLDRFRPLNDGDTSLVENEKEIEDADSQGSGHKHLERA